jgi:phosphopantothenoylcysteine decarboxylase/phosphopantothenate--cysteine ligase
MAFFRPDTMNIILGITGSISAYKAPWLVRDLRRAGHDVRVVMTPSATRFVAPLALEATSTHPVVVHSFDPTIQDRGSWHVHLAHWADVMLIAPCSASTLARIAHGEAESAVALVALSLPTPSHLIVAPAMDAEMWLHPSTQRNVQQLRTDGSHVIEPATGALSSGLTGPGRLVEIGELVRIVHDHAESLSHSDIESGSTRSATQVSHEVSHNVSPAVSLRSAHVLITSGPTFEDLDDVRFLGNRASGRMGIALAEAARDRGALVTLVMGPSDLPTPLGIERIDVRSAQQMHDAVMAIADADVVICAAAVADYRPKQRVTGKIKKDASNETLTIELERTPDILATVAAHRREGQVIVGFALESTNVIDYAKEKLQRKRCDLIVANEANAPRSGFGGVDNTITIVTADAVRPFPPMSKRACAEVILDAIEDRRRTTTP